MVADELLVDVEHGQQDVEQVGCRAGGVSRPEGPWGQMSPGLWPIGLPREAVSWVQIPTAERFLFGDYLGITLIHQPYL